MKVKKITYYLDGDTLEVNFKYDEKSGVWHGDYPDLAANPKYTSSGRPWVDATKDDCDYSGSTFNDCGSCEYLLRQNPSDLLGVCMNENNKIPIDGKEDNSQ